MGLVLFLVFILIFILLAFLGVFGKFPDSWSWFGIILAGLGIAMTAPTIFQMFWGGPRVDVSFEHVDNPQKERSLQVFFSNPPINNKVLKFFHVRRENVQSLSVQFRILDEKKNPIIPIHHGLLYADDVDVVSNECKGRISLPPTSSVGASTLIVIWDNGAVVPPDRLRPLLRLPVGNYSVILLLMVDGEPRQIMREFVIGQKSTDLCWLPK